ncbi:retrotransposon gag protein [Trifolium medium]|uniref:Retrotransposon gag protein n=1 Tax=Trifolium medium TaxID=97028 RepID=A0A392QD35_9FABA|nr:retrotransposon gag protein [Trifolium medium]
MPPKKNVPKMGDRVDAIEADMSEVKATLLLLTQQMQQQTTAQQQQSLLLSELSKKLGVNMPTETVQESEQSVGADQYQESRLSGKVKLPAFEGEDSVAWITRTEIYFDVQQTSDAMRIKLARLSMDGATIHWFNLLLETG